MEGGVQMGGGHLSRLDFGDAPAKPGPSPDGILSASSARAGREGVFALPALYAAFQAPARRIYADEAADYLTLSETRRRAAPAAPAPDAPNFIQQPPRPAGRHPGGSSPHRGLPCTRPGDARGCSSTPLVWEDPLPPLPDCAAALTLTLTLRDVEAIDADPAALARRLCREAAGKHWLATPKADTYLAGRIALLQRLYKR